MELSTSDLETLRKFVEESKLYVNESVINITGEIVEELITALNLSKTGEVLVTT